MSGWIIWFERVVIFAVSASVIEFTVSTMPVGESAPLLRMTAAVLRVWFVIEYALRIVMSSRKWRYVVSVAGVADLLAVVLDAGVLKLLRLLKLTSRATALNRLKRGVFAVRHELAAAAVGTGMLLYVSAVALYYAERDVQPDTFSPIPAALWWSVITLTTVGYGDVTPVTPAGRVLTGIVVLLGIGVVAVPTGLIASGLSRDA